MTTTADLTDADLERRAAGGYQLLQTLVGIRLRSVADPESRRHLTWLSDVVAAMGLLNRRTADSGAVDFPAYLEDAAAFWRRAVEDRGVRIEVRANQTDLPQTHAVAAAIIVHELVGNAVRHAFPKARRGTIAIAWSSAASGVSLVIRDTGVGAAEPAFGEGLLLVEGLVQHLNGTLAVETAPDAGFGIRIRLPIHADSLH